MPKLNSFQQLINNLNLPPNSQSLNIKSFKQKSFIHYYIIHNNQYILFHSHNYFKSLTNPNTSHFKSFPTLSSLQQYTSTL